MEAEVSVRTTVRLARSWKKEEREKEEASHAHVITNAAGIHDPTSPRPSTSTPPRPSATTTSRRSFSTRPPRLSLVRTGGPRSRPYNVHVLNGGPTTKQEERKTFSNSASTRSSFTEPAPHNRTPTGVRLGMGRNEWKTSTDASPRMCPNPCLLSYST